MNGQRRMRLGRWAALCGIAAGMSLSGITYASWSDTLQVSGDLSTGRFHMVLADTPQAYTLSLLDQAGTRLETLPGVQVTRTADGRSAELAFCAGLPLDSLRDGGMLRLSTPLTNGDGTLTDIRRYEPDFTAPWKTVPLTPERMYLVTGGQAYIAADIPQEYAAPLEFDLYRSFEGEPDALYGSIYFQLSAASRAHLDLLPQALTLPAGALSADSLVPAAQLSAAVQPGQDGVLVQYTCDVPLALDQSHQPDDMTETGEEAPAP